MFEAGPIIGYHQFQLTIAVDVLARHGQGAGSGNGELRRGILEYARRGLHVHVQGARFAGVVMVHPGGRHDQIQQAVAGQVGGGDIVGAGGR